MSQVPKQSLLRSKSFKGQVKIKNGVLPESPGVYLMCDKDAKILYVGKATSLKRRVESYFTHPHDARIEAMVGQIAKIDYRETANAVEALILEAELIKKYQPPFNIREKDGKSFLYVQITKDKFPRVLIIREKGILAKGTNFGPFTSSSSLREALKIIRRIFPYSVHPESRPHSAEAPRGKPCFDYQIGLCPGTCAGLISKADYAKNISNIKLFFKGEKKKILRNLEAEMKKASRNLEFEKAEKIKRQVFAINHINDVALIHDDTNTLLRWEAMGGQARMDTNDTNNTKPKNRNTRIEGYDISNISGTSAVGVMVVFEDGEPKKSDYRKFKIKTIEGANPARATGGDTGMLKEVLRRRLNHDQWPLPVCFLIDGGKGQVNAVKEVLAEYGYEIPVVGIAKGPERKRNDFIGAIPKNVLPITLIRLRDEAHRFAISYHKKIRNVQSFK